MSKSFLFCPVLVLLGLFTACQPNDEPIALKLETTPANQLLTKLPPADTLFATFYATQQESVRYRLSAIKAYIQASPKADSSTLQFIYQGNQLTDKKLRPAGSATLIDLPRKLTFDRANRLVLSEALATSAASQTGTYGDARTEYTYEGDALKRAVRYSLSASGTLLPAADITYTYLNGRYSSAFIKSYVSLWWGLLLYQQCRNLRTNVPTATPPMAAVWLAQTTTGRLSSTRSSMNEALFCLNNNALPLLPKAIGRSSLMPDFRMSTDTQTKPAATASHTLMMARMG